MVEGDYQRVFRGQYGSYNQYPKGPNDDIVAGLCYIFGWIVSLVALLAIRPLSPYLRFHAIQALGLRIVLILLYCAMLLLYFILIGICLYPFIILVGIYSLVVGVILLTGSDHRVPWLGNYVEERFV